ncbi:DUF2947 family protein [Piscinibacter gummiphilus]|uniref:DUF2947 family protein n=1 Tax=Piscinibacter gummiphilus TaxID=946333 RepID=A0ABZ0CPM2_9BURK|nr:DUF2947 family protein [Piscinibacter gummiphilus]WOB06937.1 DUF2947 family protein [Piscinibacter gummiphilus]
MLPSTSFRPLDPETDWAFFDPGFHVPQEIQAEVQALTEAGSAELWTEHVSANPNERHPMLLPGSHWLKPKLQGPNWMPEFNGKQSEAAVGTFLQEVFELGMQELILFIAMRERSYSVPFGVFLRHWPSFVAGDDEGSFLFHPRSGAFACFGPNGSLSFGRRSANAA